MQSGMMLQPSSLAFGTCNKSPTSFEPSLTANPMFNSSLTCPTVSHVYLQVDSSLNWILNYDRPNSFPLLIGLLLLTINVLDISDKPV